MHAHSVQVFNSAHNDAVVLAIAHHFKLIFLPTQRTLIDQYLANHAGGNSATRDFLKLIHVPRNAAAGTTKSERGANDGGQTNFLHECFRVLNRCHSARLGLLQSKFFNNGAEGFAVLCAVNGFAISADHFNIHARKCAVVMQGTRAIQRGLSTKRWKQCVNRCSKIALLLQNFSHSLGRDGLDVGTVAKCRIRHNGGGIGVDQHNAVALFTQRLTRLSSGIIKLTTLTNHNWSTADDQDCVNVLASRHGIFCP